MKKKFPFCGGVAALSLVFAPLASANMDSCCPYHGGGDVAGPAAPVGSAIAYNVETVTPGSEVMLKGTVEAVSDGGFTLADETGTIEVTLSQAIKLAVGDSVVVYGSADEESEIAAVGLTLADGTTVDVTGRVES